MAEHSYTVLFLCTGNSARSILAEGTLNQLGKGRFIAFSAGSHPTGKVNPFAIELLSKMGIPTESFRSKNWDEFSANNAAALDFVITVCDNAAGEVCPLWPGQPMTAHWGVADPAAANGTDEDKRRAFLQAYNTLKRRIELFLSLPIETLDRISLHQQLKSISDK
jgi:arsenate reductase (thioredoxin)